MTNFITSNAAREITSSQRVFQNLAEPIVMVLIAVIVLGGMLTAVNPILIT